MSLKYTNILLVDKKYLLPVTLVLLIGIFVISYYLKNKSSVKQLQGKISYIIDYEFIKLHSTTDSVVSLLSKSEIIPWDEINKLTKITNSGCYIYTNDSLRYWNTYTVTQSIPRIFNSQGDTAVQLNNGIYLVHQERINTTTIIVFRAIQHDYQVENNFLKTTLSIDVPFNSEVVFSLKNETGPYKMILEKKGVYHLVASKLKNRRLSTAEQIFLFFLYLTIYGLITLIIFGLSNKLGKLIKSNILANIIFVIVVISIRLLENEFQIFPLLKHSSIFTKQFTSLFLFDTPGNIITNLLLLIITLYLILNQINTRISKSFQYPKQSIYYLFVISIGMLGYGFMNKLLLTNDSAFFPKEISNLSSEWEIMSILILINAIMFFLLSRWSASQVSRMKQKLKLLLVPLFSLPTLFLLPDDFIFIGISTWVIVTILFTSYLLIENFKDSIIEILVILILLAGTSAIIINKTLSVKAADMQQFTANVLAQKNDPLLEYEFAQLTTSIKHDNWLFDILLKDSEPDLERIEQYLKDQYFQSSFKKYNIQITICDSTDYLDIQNEKDLISCDSFFDELILQSGKHAIDSSLYLIDNHTENIYYLGILTVKLPDNRGKNIYLEIVAPYVPEGLGYPELLIDQRAQAYSLKNLSYARYFNSSLFYKFGDFHYPIIYNSEPLPDKESFYTSHGYRHYIVPISDEEKIIVSQVIKSTNMILFPFSMLFLVFSLLAGLYYLINLIAKSGVSQSVSLRTKLQLFITGTIILTIVLLALVTIFFMKNNSINETKKQLEEKTYSVFIELQHKLGQDIRFTEEENSQLEVLIKKFSLVFFSDINLYEPTGKLAATSRPEMETKGLLSNLINPEAYQALILYHQPSYITEEKIGSLTYYSSYLPLFLSENQPQAIINLPFFARQTEVTQTYSGLLATFINLAVLIGIIGTLLTLIISRILTRPLLMLQQRMASIQIDKPNKIIYWHNKDEIGQLINQYNSMVEKLEVSAELLKHSERESTWREMARQIAHEIKNPLTPMKLNVQYLDKAYQEHQPDFPQKIASITKSLIEQIETLNNVADMFGEIASTPTKTIEEIRINELLDGVVALFDSQEGINFKLDKTAPDCKIKAVEKDMIRVMNNLIKNAVQSFTNQPRKEITIRCTTESDQVIISIADNGKGMDLDTRQNIFKPYFTTKTSGTGLGLAIVKSIVLENNGQIRFTSNPGKGTTFTLTFPQI
ncbi:MAG: HAMP domain-containing sensor histidine kinase [Bacteroidales bacterium]|nr:HAMP domain-containing sensor histidine kinase [Bacteroidales bacterium]